MTALLCEVGDLSAKGQARKFLRNNVYREVDAGVPLPK